MKIDGLTLINFNEILSNGFGFGLSLNVFIDLVKFFMGGKNSAYNCYKPTDAHIAENSWQFIHS
jgi:hypothetical protein